MGDRELAVYKTKIASCASLINYDGLHNKFWFSKSWFNMTPHNVEPIFLNLIWMPSNKEIKIKSAKIGLTLIKSL